MPLQGPQEGQGFARVTPVVSRAQNWTSAQLRAATYSRRGFFRLVGFLAASVALLVFLGLWMAGLLPQVREGLDHSRRNALMAMGFTVERIDIIGEGYLPEYDVRAALQAREGDYFFALDLDAAQDRLETLPWVEHVVVRRLWPDRLVVQVIEKRPAAVWQSGDALHLIDDAGEVIGGTDAVRSYTASPTLPHLVGADAHLHLANLEALAARPLIRDRLRASVRVGERWDLVLHGDLRVQLPVQGADAALDRLAKLHDETQLLDRTVANIDLRLADRLTIRPASVPAS